MQYDTKVQAKAKLQRKAKLEYNNQSSPPMKRETNSKLPSQACKLGLVKWFGEDIYNLVLGINVVHIDITFLIVVTHARSESGLLCALFLSGGLGFWLCLWHWCCHKTKAFA
jgi:hypothetical protein